MTQKGNASLACAVTSQFLFIISPHYTLSRSQQRCAAPRIQPPPAPARGGPSLHAGLDHQSVFAKHPPVLQNRAPARGNHSPHPVTISRQPGTSVVTTGRPQAAAFGQREGHAFTIGRQTDNMRFGEHRLHVIMPTPPLHHAVIDPGL